MSTRFTVQNCGKANRTETASLKQLIEDLENWPKCNNIVIWGVEEGSERAHTSMEEFISVATFQDLMTLERPVEVMRVHRINIKQNASDPPKPSPIHVYLLRYADKVFIHKLAASKLKGKKYKNSQLFISDDMSKTEGKEQANLRRDYLPAVKPRTNIQFSFIPWSVPAQILYKEDSTEKLKSFTLPKE